MQIDIQARDFTLTDALRDHAERRLRSTLTCCDNHIRKIIMYLSDINGPRGGKDKRCNLQVVLAGIPDVIIEDIETDMYVAIDRATDRAGRTLIRKIDRKKSLERQVRPSNTNTTILEPSLSDEQLNEKHNGNLL